MALATYLTALAALVPASSWVADRFGAKRVFLAAMAVFLTGSVCCAIQDGLAGLFLSRGVQGAGAAMMVPVGRLTVLRNVSKAEMVRALAYITIPALMGPALGPLVGAAVTATLGWRWIFLSNLPIGLSAMLLAWRYLPNVAESARRHFDILGFVLSAAGLAALMFGLSAMGDFFISTQMALVVAASGAAALAGYVVRTTGREDALLDTHLFAKRTFNVGILSGTLFRLSGGAAAFVLPLLFQIGLGLPILISGLLSGIFALGGLTMRALAPRLLDRFGFRRSLVAGALLSAAAFVGFGSIQSVSYPFIIVLLLLGGFAQALVFTAVNGLVFADVSEAEMSRASSFSAVTQQFALTLGIALSGPCALFGHGFTVAA